MRCLKILCAVAVAVPALAEQCAPPVHAYFKEASVPMLKAEFAEESTSCRSYLLAYELFERSGDFVWLKEAGETLLRLEDPGRALRILLPNFSANSALGANRELRLLLLRAEAEAARTQKKTGDMSWAEYFLGIQHSDWPELKAQNFQQDFPEQDSEFSSLYAGVVDLYVDNEVRVAEFQRGKKEFLSALFRLEFLARKEFVLADRRLLVKVLRLLSDTEDEFADYLEDSGFGKNKWPDSRLKTVPGIPQPFSRARTIKYFREKADKTKPENLLGP